MPTDSYKGCVERFVDGVAEGWVFSAADMQRPVGIHVVIDGQEVQQIVSDGERVDVQKSTGHPTGRVGFSYRLPAAFRDGQEHRLSFRLLGSGVLGLIDPADPGTMQLEIVFCLNAAAKFDGYVDGLRRGQIVGWALQSSLNHGRLTGGCHLLVTCDGIRVTELRADRPREDVARARGCDPNCGFQFTIPTAFRSRSPRTFRVEVLPERTELTGSPLVTSTVDDSLEAELLDVSARMDTLLRELFQLRRRVADLLPQPGYSLTDYDHWARTYFPALRAQMLARRGHVTFRPDPLVSILMPAYKPVIRDFEAAVASVISQTYQNWELVIVDDASRQAALTARIAAFCASDGRIRCIKRKRNGNISEATNTAIDAARGEWVAFMDHDDLLADVSIEVMVRAAQDTGASMLYSDEDKIDAAGYFTEPNFKPDWNYRYLLGCNYVCHLLFVAAEALKKVAKLDSRYDGSQDHDLVLRLSEYLPAGAIRHVPAVLYHWRKTATSTATDTSQKGYAVAAGVLAIKDHLARRGLPAAVQGFDGLTIYNPTWNNEASPVVCVVILVTDMVEAARSCLQTVLGGTDYAALELLLIDHGLVTAEAAAFMEKARQIAGVRVQRGVQNSSNAALRNMAASQTQASFLMFLDSALIPSGRNWLRLLVDEALVDETVAAVAGRYVYPDMTVFHAGIAVGPAEGAVYLHRGKRFDEAGFCCRLALAQEVTAVSGAGILVRADAFAAVGGFNEDAGAFDDIDLCLKLRRARYRVIYCANMVALYTGQHGPGIGNRSEPTDEFLTDQQALVDRWRGAPFFEVDPGYNPHFLIDGEPFYDLASPNLPMTERPASG